MSVNRLVDQPVCILMFHHTYYLVYGEAAEKLGWINDMSFGRNCVDNEEGDPTML